MDNPAPSPQCVVVGIDGSSTASRAARAAAELAQARRVPLHIVSAFGPVAVQTVQADGQNFVLHHEDLARNDVEKEADALRAAYPGLEVRTATGTGKPAQALSTYAEAVGAAVIVVGNRRMQGIGRLLGSVASDVAQKAPCDVYIAHTAQ